MLNQATREELISRNVARLVQPPTPDRDEIQPWTDTEARHFRAAATEHRLHALFVLALAVGLRRGELLGLRWLDVDLAAKQLRVTQTLQRVRDQGIVYGPPKSRTSRRVLSLPTVAVTALTAHQDGKTATARRPAPTGTRPSWSSPPPPRHVEPRNLNTAFARLTTRACVRPIRFHNLRHTFATLLLSRGVSPRIVMDILGHSQSAVTMNIYGHVMPTMQQEAVGHIDAALAQPEPGRGDER